MPLLKMWITRARKLLGLFALRRSSGELSWFRTVSVYTVAAAVAALAFVIGVRFGDSPGYERLENRIQAFLSGERPDPLENWATSGTDTFTLRWKDLESNNQTLEKLSFPISNLSAGGGSLVELGTTGDLLFTARLGSIGLVSFANAPEELTVEWMDTEVPIGLEAFDASPMAAEPRFNRSWLRTMDSVVRELDDGSLELFVSHHRFEGSCLAFTVSSIVLSVSETEVFLDEGASWRTVWQANPCLELKPTGNLYSGLRDGGRMAWAKDGKLLVTVGDFDLDGDNSPINAPQDLNYDQGKVHLIDPETGQNEIFAWGMRNPQGLVITGDGAIYSTEHGPYGGDEINLVEQGVDYGWPAVTLGMGYGFPRRDWPNSQAQGRHDGFQSPVFAFVPSVAASAIVSLENTRFDDWEGDLLMGSLESETLYRLRRSGTEIIYSEPIPIGERIRDIEIMQSGIVALLTDAQNIWLLRPKVKPNSIANSPSLLNTAQTNVSGYQEVRTRSAAVRSQFQRAGVHEGQITFEAKCASCHSLSRDEVLSGPPLHNLRGRTVGSLDGFPYSDVLAQSDHRWDEIRLRRYLSDPDSMYPGSNMPYVPATWSEHVHLAWWMMNCTSGRDHRGCHVSK